MYRCPIPRFLVRFSKFLNWLGSCWETCEVYEESLSKQIKKSKAGKFINRYKAVFRNGIFVVLLWQKMEAVKEADDFKRANEVLVNHQAVLSGKYESQTITRWKKLMIGDIDHSPSFIMVEISPSYERKFLELYKMSIGDYLGRTDFHIWGEEIAMEYYLEDVQVARTGNPMFTIGSNPLGGELYILKERLMVDKRIYILGTAIDTKESNAWTRLILANEKQKQELKKIKNYGSKK